MSLLPIIDIIGKVIDRVIPDPAQKMQLQLELSKLADQEAERQHEENMGQIGTNTEEAKNSNLFVAGWRPAVGWICAVAVGYSFVLEPFLAVILRVCGFKGDLPALPMEHLMTLIMGMLGMGYLRTKEKINGVPDSTPIGASPETFSVPPLPTQKKKGLGSKVFGSAWPF